MKQLFFIILFFIIIIQNGFAQDTIIKYNSDKIIAKILEITPTEVKYKKFNFLDGPTYIEMKSDIKMVIYSNGTKEQFQQDTPQKTTVKINDNGDYYTGATAPVEKITLRGSRFIYQNRPINERQLHEMLLRTKDKRIITLVGEAKDAKLAQFIGFGAIPFGIAAEALFFTSIARGGATPSGSVSANPSYLAGSGLCLVAAIACPITGGIYKQKRKAYNREAIRLYNENF